MVRSPLGRTWLWYLCAGAVLTAGYVGLELGSATESVLYDVMGLSAVTAIVIGVLVRRPRASSAWLLVAGGQLLFVMGDMVWTLYEEVLHIDPWPSIADAFYLAGYPVMAAGVLRLVRARRSGKDRTRLLEASIIATGLGAVTWQLLVEPILNDQSLSTLEAGISVAYPIGDILILAVAARLIVGMGRNASFRLFGLSLVTLLGADVVYGVAALEGTYASGGLIDGGYLLSYFLMGAAALHPKMSTITERGEAEEGGFRLPKLALLATASLLGPVVVLVQPQLRPEEAVFAAMSAAVLFLLVLARMWLLVNEVDHKAGVLERQGATLRETLTQLERAQDDRRRLLAKTLRAGEEERLRVAADLHDGPIQRLAAVGFGLERARLRIERGDGDGAIEVLAPAQERLSREMQALRELMASLRPPALDEQGLEGALRDQVASFAERCGVTARVESALDERLEPEVETVLYRVAQEALLNVAKHAGASTVIVQLARSDGNVEMVVRDDGVGFDPAATGGFARENHFGLLGMREQARLAGGSCRVTSAPGSGTAVEVNFPLKVPA